jgi:hypothetical protein
MSYYNALQLSFERRFNRGLLLRMNYAFARNVDTSSIQTASRSVEPVRE